MSKSIGMLRRTYALAVSPSGIVRALLLNVDAARDFTFRMLGSRGFLVGIEDGAVGWAGIAEESLLRFRASSLNGDG